MSLSVTETESSTTIKVGDVPVTVATLFDHLIYRTNQPASGSLITWSATLDGVARTVLVSDGIPPLFNTTLYEDVGGGFWGTDTILIVFPFLTASDVGKVLKIAVSGELEGVTLTKSVNLMVVEEPPPGPVYSTIITIHVSSSREGSGAYAFGGMSSTRYPSYSGFRYSYPYGGPGAWTLEEYETGPIIIPSSDHAGRVLGAYVPDTVKIKSMSGGAAGDVTTVQAQCDVYEDDVLIATYTKTVSATSTGSGWTSTTVDWITLTETGAIEL
jgi:hypothetical protein